MTTANPYSILDHLANGTVACEGGGDRCERIVRSPEQVADALAEDYSNFPYCPPCRVDAAADAVQDDPEHGPLREAPSRAAALVDGLLANAYRRGLVTMTTQTYVEHALRSAIEAALVGLPTGGGTRRDEVADHIAGYAEGLRILTRRTVDGTLDVRLYADLDDD